MADTLTTTAAIDPAVETFYDRVLLRAAFPRLVHLKWAQHASMDKKRGNTYKWRRYSNLSVATTPLTEGADPPGQALSKTDLTAQMSWYGDFVHVTDVVDLTVEDAVLTVAAEKLGLQQGQTFDTLMRDILSACASATNAAGGSNGNTPTEITTADIEGVVQTLLGYNAEMVTEMIKGSSGVGTSPVRPAFWGIINTAIIDDLEDCAGFKATAEYASQGDVDDAEWGTVKNVRFCYSTNAKATAETPVQYHIPIIGKDAYGDVALLGKHNMKNGETWFTSENIVKPFGSGGTADPLNRKATSGWKAVWAARILNDQFMHILEVTASA